MRLKSAIRYLGRITFLFCTLYPLAFVIGAIFFTLQYILLNKYPFPPDAFAIMANGVPFAAFFGALYFCAPGCIVAAASAVLLASRAGRRADVCLCASTLLAFVVFQQWNQIDVITLKNHMVGDMISIVLSPILAALGFGLGSFILALILPESLLSSSGDFPQLVSQRRLASLQIALPILLFLVTFSALYFYEYSLHSY